MAKFDETKSYAVQEETFFDDGREEELVEYVRNHADRSSIQGSPEKVVQAIDEYARKKRYLMNVGDVKGLIITDIIKERKPQTMVELGGYCGYSTILFASTVQAAGGKNYYTVERNLKFAKVITQLVEFAGLDGFVEVIVGPSHEAIKNLHSRGLKSIDMMFLDHYKPAYTTDLKLCEELNLIKKGTILVADNVINPGNPPYLEYVRSNVEQKKERLKQESKLGTNSFAERSAAQYGYVEVLNTTLKGNPNIIYESQLVNSFEPTGELDGIEITRCQGEAAGGQL